MTADGHPVGWGIGLFDDDKESQEDYIHHWPWPFSEKRYYELSSETDEVTRWAESKPVQTVTCEASLLDEYTACRDSPQLVKVIAAPTYHVGTTVTLTFNKNTNKLDLSPEELFHFTGGSLGAELSGEWRNEQEYVITVVNSSGHTQYHEPETPLRIEPYHAVPSVEVINRRKWEWFNSTKSVMAEVLHSGNITCSLGFAGSVHFKYYQLDMLSRTPRYQTQSIQVTECGIPEPLHRKPFARSPPKWHLKGPLALDGNFNPKIRLSAAEDQPFEFEFFSLAFDMYLPSRQGVYQDEEILGGLRRKADSLRALFYHGPGLGHEQGRRTPSLWLLPRSNRVTLRLSTNLNVDDGWDSELEVPTDNWFKLQVDVYNHSDGFTAHVHCDDLTIIRVNSSSVLLPSIGYLHIGQDAWGSGQAMFIKNVVLRDSKEQRIPDDDKKIKPLPTSAPAELDNMLNAHLMHKALHEPGLDTRDIVEQVEVGAQDEHAPALVALALINLCGVNCWRLFEVARSGNQTIYTNFDDKKSSLDTIKTEQVARLLERSAALGNSDAMLLLGILIDYGIIKSDLASAEQLALESSLRGNILGKFWLAQMCEEDESTAFLYADLSSIAQQWFHQSGGEPFIDSTRLSEHVEVQGEGGEDDGLIEYDKFRAAHGDVSALNAMGSRYYWGKNGLARDQARAFDFFERAANLGHAPSMTACGNMLLKGEGVSKNVDRAIGWYEKAVAKDETSAMNGLGFIHFFGNGNISANATRALALFQLNLRDGDSLFNAAYILLQNDTPQYNSSLAIEYLLRAAHTHGSFDAAKTLGDIYMYGTHSEPRSTRAISLLRSAALRGVWGRFSRVGFDNFIQGRHNSAFFAYLVAAALGYDHALGNALWLRVNRKDEVSGAGMCVRRFAERLTRVEHYVPEANLYLGDYYFNRGSTQQALRLWITAGSQVSRYIFTHHARMLNESLKGDWSIDPLSRARANFNVAWMLDTKAVYYLQRAMSQLRAIPEKSGSKLSELKRGAIVAVELALLRESWKTKHPRLFALIPSFFWGVTTELQLSPTRDTLQSL